MRIKSENLVEHIKQTKPWIVSVVCDDFKNLNAKVIIIDKDFGEYTTAIKNIRRGCEHPKRAMLNRQTKLKNNGQTLDVLKQQLLSIQPFVLDIDLSTYVNNKSKVKVIDKIYGEYETTVFILKKGCQHPARKYDRVKKTVLAKYGVENPMQSKEVQKTLQNTNLQKYGVKNAWLTEESQRKAWDTKKKNGSFARSVGQIELQTFINNLGIGIADTCRINKVEYDIKINNILIEYNGEFWHSEKQGKDKNYHLAKSLHGKTAGYQVIHIWEHQWQNKPNQIKSFLRSKLGANEHKIYARQCEIKKITLLEAKDFINKYHIQGYARKTIDSFGLFFNDSLVGVASFAKHHRNNVDIVLNRFVCIDNTTIVGGLSKISKHASKYYKSNITSWADKCLSEGNGYIQAGWNLNKILDPDYFYYHLTTSKIIKKQSRKKDKVKTPEGMTEKQHAELDNLTRVWDCGKIRFIYEYKP